MHPKDNLLRAMLDQELPATQSRLVQEHLARCPDCREHFEAINRQAGFVQSRMKTLAPGPFEQPRAPQAAYQRFASNSRINNQRKETVKNMLKRRSVWAAVTVLIALALVFSLTPASAWASSFLGLFRVQKVQVITFDPAAAEQARGKLDANRAEIEQVFQDDVKVTHHGEAASISSKAEAAQKLGFTPRLPAALDGAKLSFRPGMNAVITLDQPKLQALLDAAGVDARLPESVNGKAITVDVPDGLAASSGCASVAAAEKAAGAGCTVLMQLPSPVVNAPEGLDVPKLGQALFQFLGLSPAEAQQLSQRIDWTSTLIIPVPQDGKVQYQEVQVDGVSGTLLQQEGQGRYTLIWAKDGILYGLSGQGSTESAIEIANSLR